MVETLTEEDCFSQISKLNAKLIQSESSKTRFLSLIRNEFDNPMVGMVTLLRQLNQPNSETMDEDARETLHLVYMDALKLNFQLSNIISVASVETGVLEHNTTIFNIASMLDDIDDALRHIFETKLLKVTKNIQCSEEIFYEYSTPSTEVEINIFEDDGKLFISVRNRGDKIKDSKAIFDAFYQQTDGYNRTHQGLGVGLSVVGAFVDFLGGDIFITRDGDSNVFVASVPSLEQDSAIGFGGELDAFFFDD